MFSNSNNFFLAWASPPGVARGTLGERDFYIFFYAPLSRVSFLKAYYLSTSVTEKEAFEIDSLKRNH